MNRVVNITIKHFIVFLLILLGNIAVQSNPVSELDKDISYQKGRDLYNDDNYVEALEMFKKSLEERRNIFGETSVSVGNIYAWLGLVYKKLGFVEDAIENSTTAAEVYGRIEGVDVRRLAIIHNQLSTLYKMSGDIDNAISYLKNTERIILQNDLPRDGTYESMLINFANIYTELGEFDKALDYIEKAQDVIAGKPREINLKNVEGLLYLEMKDYPRALKEYNIALKLGEEYYGEGYIDKYKIYINLGFVYLNIEDFDNAIKYFGYAREIVAENFGEKNYNYSVIQNNIGEVYLKKSEKANSINQFLSGKRKNLRAALKSFQSAIIAVSTDFDNKDIYVNPDIGKSGNDLQLLAVLKGKGEAFSKLALIEKNNGKRENEIKYLQVALETYEVALEFINRIRSGFLNQKSKMILAENEHVTHFNTCEIATTLFELTQNTGYFEKAFQVSERSKSASFLAAMRDLKAHDFGGIPDSLLKKVEKLKSDLVVYKELLYTEYENVEEDSVKIKYWEGRVFELEQEQSSLVDKLEEEYPDYHSLKYSNRVVSLKEIQSRLKSRDAILEYVVNEPEGQYNGEIISFMITKNHFRLNRTEIDSSYNNYINDFLGFLKNGQVANTTKREFVQYTNSASHLYNLLVSPFEDYMKGFRVVCIPDGKLAYLPFDALISEKPDTTRMDFRNLKYFVKDFSISYSYSATLLYDYFKKDVQAEKGLVAFAPSYNNTPEIDINSVRAIREKLLPLPGAKLEVKGILDLISGDAYEGKEATETSFKEKAGQYDILHLAMHTVINDSLPMYSKLVFEIGEDTENNGCLDTYEVYNMRFKARLAVLSACKTGVGHLQKGEGVLSLARGFLYAGCPSIIMTLWNVEDKSSAKLMIDFYENLLAGYPKDEALRRAKLLHLETADPLKAHPYYWLGYVAVGDQSPLYSTKMPYFLGLIVLLLLIILVEKYISRRRRRDSI